MESSPLVDMDSTPRVSHEETKCEQAEFENGISTDSQCLLNDLEHGGRNQDVRRRDCDDSEPFAARETIYVMWLKAIVLIVLFAFAISVAIGVYFYTSNAEKSEFKNRFHDDALKVFEVMGNALILTLGGVDAFIVNLVSYSKYSGNDFPFVTLPNYAVQVAKVRTLSKAVLVSQFHKVSDEQKIAWQNFSSGDHSWVDEALEIQKDDRNFFGVNFSNYTTVDYIYTGFGTPITAPGPFFPQWQTSPLAPLFPPYNWDAAYFDPLREMLPDIETNKRVVISKVSNLGEEQEIVGGWIKNYLSSKEDAFEPLSHIHYPILNGAASSIDVFNNESDYTSGGELVGIFQVTFFWRDLIRNILPPGSDGIVVVFGNSCNQTFTYVINGLNPVYLGEGDLHDAEYNSLEQSSTLLDLDAFAKEGRAAYTGIPLSAISCPYWLKVYPSKEMEDSFTTGNPVRFSTGAVLIFVFTAFIVLAYDNCVERRQKKIMTTALRSTANVSLLEKKVQERTHNLEVANRRVVAASKAQLQHFACMSHEIRTPLNCIIGLSSLLGETDLSPMQSESVKMVVNSGDLLLTVVNDVLDYSKLESGNVDIEVERSNLQDTLSSVVHSIETRAKSKKIKIRTFYDPVIGEFIYTDRRRLQQILYNLLGNAVKFSKEGGTVDLAVVLCSVDAVHDGTWYDKRDGEDEFQDNGSATEMFSPSTYAATLPGDDESESNLPDATDRVVRFIVKDSGAGIDMKDFETIFRPFCQASAETERVYGGTGLGLAITAKLVARLKGKIGVKSMEGSWSKFTVDLPFRDSPVAIDEITLQLSHVSILLVENDDDVEKGALRIFEAYGVDAKKFRSIEELGSSLDSSSSLASYICLINEELYTADEYRKVLDHLPQSTLVTYGPKYSVPDSKGHFRSLLQVLPSVLMQSFATLERCSSRASLPRLARPMPKAHSLSMAERLAASPFRNLRVLVAEDNLINQKVLTRILNRLGVTHIIVADNGQIAVEKELSEGPFDVILMDRQMPVMDGVSSCRAILARNEIESHPKPKVIFATADVADESAKECEKAGGIGFLPKPFNYGDVETCLQVLQSSRDK